MPTGSSLAAATDEPDDRHGWVSGEQPDELRADVAGRADDGDPDRRRGRPGRRSAAAAVSRPALTGASGRSPGAVSSGRSGWIAVMDA